jgi:hypothetical protein
MRSKHEAHGGEDNHLATAIVTPSNLSQIQSAHYAFHHNPRIIVVIHIT